MIAIPILTSTASDHTQSYHYLRVGRGWTRWMFAGVLYTKCGDTVTAIDTHGRRWHYDPFRVCWLRDVGAVA